ncbi:hypothetical protein GCM10007416_17820 [Kroppenstedtia guangzhouensis]|uniref:Uncharacterized protein n=1 Tax=Kroppenstedtia guangzhouensis TaxID=1274356 RepID=A0ABQ1GJK5_9BACL|nr:hypothetical protein GCM10007416_17820 [Kroppenstedtia guangzhouensis]
MYNRGGPKSIVKKSFQEHTEIIVKSRSQGGLGFTWSDFGSFRTTKRSCEIRSRPGQHSFTTTTFLRSGVKIGGESVAGEGVFQTGWSIGGGIGEKGEGSAG